ncbi:MAG: flagellar filament capping protein FliD [Salinisphaera sp.]|jgi:flagellar hook-associated protein 2|nr:flagellar filament capping protein FliD [Salinisphaera sp.]
MASSSSISSLGVGSGLDLSSLLDKLKSSQQARLQPLNTKETSYNAQLTAYGQVKGALDNLKTAAVALNSSDLFQSTSANVVGSAFTATTASGAVPGSYAVQVNQLASAQSLYSAGVTSSSDLIGKGGTLTIGLGGASGPPHDSVTINLAAADSSLQGVRDAINKANVGVSASIVNDGSSSPYRLVLSSDATGIDNQISVTATDAAGATGTPLASLLDYHSASGSDALTQSVAATDASLTVNGIAITRSSNTVSDAIQGVTLSLNSTTASAEGVSVARDDAGIKKAISTFVSAYNSFHAVVSRLTAYNSATQTGGLLTGDSATRSIQSKLHGVLNSTQTGGAFSGLAQIGVSLQKDGSMAIDDTALSTALANNPRDVAQLFSGVAGGTNNADGVAGMLSTTIDGLISDTGSLGAATAGTKLSIKDTQSSINSMQTSIDSTIARYKKQFVALDTLMSSLNSTKSYLTTQFNALNNNNGSSGN